MQNTTSEPLQFIGGPNLGFDTYLDDRLVDRIVPGRHNWTLTQSNGKHWAITLASHKVCNPVEIDKIIGVTLMGELSILWEYEPILTIKSDPKTETRWMFAVRTNSGEVEISHCSSQIGNDWKRILDDHEASYTIQEVTVELPPQVVK